MKLRTVDATGVHEHTVDLTTSLGGLDGVFVQAGPEGAGKGYITVMLLCQRYGSTETVVQPIVLNVHEAAGLIAGLSQAFGAIGEGTHLAAHVASTSIEGFGTIE